MNYRRREILSVGTATVAALAGCSAFDDDGDESDEETELDSSTVPGDEWHSFQGTPGNEGLAEETSVPTDPSERWRVSLSAGLDAQPVVGSDHAYALTSDGTLHALALDTGDTAWTESLGESRTECPCLVDNFVVAGTGDGELLALDGASGATEWTVDLPGRAGTPTPYAGTVYVGTDEGSVVGVDVESTDEQLQVDVGGTVDAAPAVTDEQLYVGVERDGSIDIFLAVDRASGEQQWQTEGLGAEAVVAADRRIVTVASGLRFFTPDGGRRGQSSSRTVPAVTRAAMYLGGEVVTALNQTPDGPSWDHWLIEAGDTQTIVPAPTSVADGTLCVPYTATAGEQGQTMLLGLDADSGDEQFEAELPAGAPTAAVLADDGIFVGTESGELLALE